MRSVAEAWRDAKTVAEQDTVFAKHGIRWSPFWRLPYWNPCRQLVVDSMHCLLEGVIKFHCLHALELTDTAAHAKPARLPAFSWTFSRPDIFDDEPLTNADEAPTVAIATDSLAEVDRAVEDGLAASDRWSQKELKDLNRIHRALTSELQDDGEVIEPSIRSPSGLQSYLANCLRHPLAYILEDVHGVAIPSGSRGRVTKVDIAHALVQWVSH